MHQEDTDSPMQTFIHDVWLDSYPGVDGEAVLYEDDCQTLDYQQEGFSLTHYTLRDLEGKLSIQGQTSKCKFFGQERHVRLQVALDAGPDKILLNGASL